MDKRALAAQVRALRAQVDALLIAIDGAELEEQGDLAACPYCGEEDPDKIEDTSESVFGGGHRARSTCLKCGKSWDPTSPPSEEQGNG